MSSKTRILARENGLWSQLLLGSQGPGQKLQQNMEVRWGRWDGRAQSREMMSDRLLGPTAPPPVMTQVSWAEVPAWMLGS